MHGVTHQLIATFSERDGKKYIEAVAYELRRNAQIFYLYEISRANSGNSNSPTLLTHTKQFGLVYGNEAKHEQIFQDYVKHRSKWLENDEKWHWLYYHKFKHLKPGDGKPLWERIIAYLDKFIP